MVKTVGTLSSLRMQCASFPATALMLLCPDTLTCSTSSLHSRSRVEETSRPAKSSSTAAGRTFLVQTLASTICLNVDVENRVFHKALFFSTVDLPAEEHGLRKTFDHAARACQQERGALETTRSRSPHLHLLDASCSSYAGSISMLARAFAVNGRNDTCCVWNETPYSQKQQSNDRGYNQFGVFDNERAWWCL